MSKDWKKFIMKELNILKNLEFKNTTKTKLKKEIFSNFFKFLKKWFCLPNSLRVNLYLIGERKMVFLKEKFFHKKEITDVIAFPLYGNFLKPENRFKEPEEEKNLLGEIFICLPMAEVQAKKEKHSLEEELLRLFLHGFLHLLGWSDKKERIKMIEIQEKILNFFLEKKKI